MILVIDNYDSFTFNLVQLLAGMVPSGAQGVVVKRNNELTIDDVAAAKPTGILLSPGPGRPEQAGITVDIVRRCGAEIPVLGVCLGHQAIATAFGAEVVQAPVLMHGRASLIHHSNRSVFRNLKNPFAATRYHSLVISPGSLPAELEVTATTDDGVIMGIQHKHFPIAGVQFHPESILTQEGERLLRNWLDVN